MRNLELLLLPILIIIYFRIKKSKKYKSTRKKVICSTSAGRSATTAAETINRKEFRILSLCRAKTASKQDNEMELNTDSGTSAKHSIFFSCYCNMNLVHNY